MTRSTLWENFDALRVAGGDVDGIWPVEQFWDSRLPLQVRQGNNFPSGEIYEADDEAFGGR